MEKIDYYEALIQYSTNRLRYEEEKVYEQENDNYGFVLNLYYKINDISIEEIDSEVNNAKDERRKFLLQELKFIKEYQLLAKKYSKLFSPLKNFQKSKLEKRITEVKNDEDVLKILETGEKLIHSSEKPLYLGISLSLIYDRLNRVDESIELIKQIEKWYEDNYLINKYLQKVLRDICFRNKRYQLYRKTIKENHNRILTYLSMNIEFYQFRYYLFITLNFIAFLLLWIIIGKKFLFVFGFLVLVNLLGIVLSIKKKELLFFNTYVLKLFVYFLMFGVSTLYYFIAK